MAEVDIMQAILETFFDQGHQAGFFVEVGAGRPDFLSMSAIFRKTEWKILSIEPNPFFCDLYRQAGYDILEYACGEYDADNVEFYVIDSHGAPYENGHVSYESFSSLGICNAYRSLFERTSHLVKRSVQTIPVKLRRLDTLLKQYASGFGEIDIISVDVEGWELAVMKGLSFKEYFPKVMLLENLVDAPEYHQFCAARGYMQWTRMGCNDVYVRQDVWARELGIASDYFLETQSIGQ